VHRQLYIAIRVYPPRPAEPKAGLASIFGSPAAVLGLGETRAAQVRASKLNRIEPNFASDPPTIKRARGGVVPSTLASLRRRRGSARRLFLWASGRVIGRTFRRTYHPRNRIP